MMDPSSKPLYFYKREEWRQWLSAHFETESEAWLAYAKKGSGKPRILYNDAVEEALCFGWIDSTVHALDDDYFLQRFTPRNPKTSFAQTNKERLKWLLDKGLVHPSVVPKVQKVAEEKFVFPKDILSEIKKEKEAWKHYQGFSDSYKRLRIAYIDDARARPEEYEKRLRNFIAKTREGKLIPGFGGIDKYY